MPVDGHWTIPEFEVPMPLDTLIRVGMLADVEGHGDKLPIEGISVALQPRRDPAAEGVQPHVPETATAVEVPAIEAVMLPFAVFGFGPGGWAYGRQIRRVYNEDGSDYEG